MTDEAMSPLRRRMIEDMTIRKFAPKTQHDYVQRVKHFAVFLGRSPDTASFEDVRRYQLHLASSGASVPTINQTVSTLRFLRRSNPHKPAAPSPPTMRGFLPWRVSDAGRRPNTPRCRGCGRHPKPSTQAADRSQAGRLPLCRLERTYLRTWPCIAVQEAGWSPPISSTADRRCFRATCLRHRCRASIRREPQ